MKDRFVRWFSTPVYPILVCLGLVLSVVISIRNTPVEFSSLDLCSIFFILVGITLSLWGFTYLVLKNWYSTGLFSVLSLLLVCSLFKEEVLLIFGVLGIILVTLVVRKKINWIVCTVTANAVSIILVSLLLGTVHTVLSEPSSLYESVDDLPNGPEGHYPDIYLLILDTYPSSEELYTQFGLSNQEFVEELRSRGLLVTENYTTSYPSTILSLKCLLGMDYLEVYPCPETVLDTPTLNLIENLGYTSILLGSGWWPTSYSTLFNYSLQAKYSGFEGFKQSVLFKGGYIHSGGHRETFRLAVPYQFAELKKISYRNESTFTFAHMQGLHNPICFGPNGEEPNMSLSDSELFSGQLDYVNIQCLDFLDSIENLESSIVIIMSDHGNFHQEDPLLSECTIDITSQAWLDFIGPRFQGFQAVYFPGNPEIRSEDLIQSNLFRTIFRRYFDMDFPNLDFKAYFVENRCTETASRLIEVTNLFGN